MAFRAMKHWLRRDSDGSSASGRDHLELVRNRVRSAMIGSPPAPWSVCVSYPIGGLTEVGFADDSDLLLVVSFAGRGLFDCLTGTLIDRNSDEPCQEWYDEQRLIATGIGSLCGTQIRLSGLHGGGLVSSGRDGWWAQRLDLDWPDSSLLLGGPGGWIYDNQTAFAKLAVEREVRAFGFSPTGQSLVIATSSDLTIINSASSASPR
ncbi:hypothetical protein Pla108_12090 [Botrimarina colliarenosi]|uniref:Uncharacterized protein n=1 Tax=Botrimarina colliarenosi TaxID=2528001 RepID=A0A5C6AMN3_9BACT|nr:hypothetical protein Pla108_12090 [Botrimarina colliarenosi]